MSAEIDRRSFLTHAGRTALLGGLGIGVLPTLLAACSSDSKSTTTTTGATPGKLEAISLQLPWVNDSESAGEFIAQSRGYYTAEGFKVSLAPGGSDIAVEPLIQSGKSLIGLTTPVFTAQAVNQGADLVIVGAKFQKNPFAITSLATKPIKSPEEMKGKKIGVGAVNEGIWTSFLKVNNISPGDVTKVVVQSDPTPLAQGEVDGWLSFYTTEPSILTSEGVKTYTFSMGDFGLHSYGDVFIVKGSALKDDATVAKIAKLMAAERKGWQASIDDPSLGADLVVNTYGKALGFKLSQQKAQCELQAQILVSDETKAKGLFAMAPSEIEANVKSMVDGGTKASTSLFSSAILDAIK
jgi:ABC-type nitrate/sulfonate/bicarbonate transport system substrate-binding protein